MVNNFIFKVSTNATKSAINYTQRRFMPVNVPPTATGKRRFRLAVETDPHKLVNYCCGLNYHKDEPLIKLKPDNEYPDWLWTLRLGPVPNSWEMEKGTKEYYLKLREEQTQQNHLNRMKADKPKKIVGAVLKKNEEYLHRIRFAALAHLEEDVGLESNSMEPNWFVRDPNEVNKREYYLPVNEERVIYMDKPPIDVKESYKRSYFDDPESTFKKELRIGKPPSNRLKPIQDSKRRHRYTGT